MRVACSRFIVPLAICVLVVAPSPAQDQSVKPGINKPFENPDVKEYIEKFEGESREIAARAKEIVAACRLKPGMDVADVGAGTGLFTRKFAPAVGPAGKVYAVEIAPAFLAHIAKTCKDAGLKNVETVLCDQFSTRLPKNSVDLVFVCDTYHHFEFPQRTLESIHDALRPGGQLILIDFHRIKGKSSEWVLGHVRAGQEVFVKEITSAGFEVVGEEKFLKENYFVRFGKKQAGAGPPAHAKPVVGLIPKAQKPVTMDGTLASWEGAFVTPVHVGHPDFANRGGQFLYLWDEQNLYIGLRCLDRTPAHVGPDNQLWNGDAVEFYLDTRRGDKLGTATFGPGTLHMFWTPFTKTEIKPRLAVRDLPAFKDFKLKGAEVAAVRTPWGYTAEFKLPWANFPHFAPKAGEILGIECELCSSDGGPRVDRTFVYSGPAAVESPSAFGRVRLADKIDGGALKEFGRVLLPLSLTKSANYGWLYGTVCVSPTITGSLANLEGRLLDASGKVRKTSTGSKKTLEGGFTLWTGSWEMFDLPPGVYTLEITATDKAGAVITSRSEKVLHGDPASAN